MSQSPPLPFALLTLSILLLSSASSVQSKVDTFTYVNEGEFGPYITEYSADYRVLPISTSPFQMAFYNTTPGEFYLALRMGTLRSESIFRWVWEANRGKPVGENATFSLLPDGNLVLAEADKRIVWYIYHFLLYISITYACLFHFCCSSVYWVKIDTNELVSDVQI